MYDTMINNVHNHWLLQHVNITDRSLFENQKKKQHIHRLIAYKPRRQFIIIIYAYSAYKITMT